MLASILVSFILWCKGSDPNLPNGATEHPSKSRSDSDNIRALFWLEVHYQARGIHSSSSATGGVYKSAGSRSKKHQEKPRCIVVNNHSPAAKVTRDGRNVRWVFVFINLTRYISSPIGILNFWKTIAIAVLPTASLIKLDARYILSFISYIATSSCYFSLFTPPHIPPSFPFVHITPPFSHITPLF